MKYIWTYKERRRSKEETHLGTIIGDDVESLWCATHTLVGERFERRPTHEHSLFYSSEIDNIREASEEEIFLIMI
jgi:hypothetical protein